MRCQPPRLAFFVWQTLALIKNLQGNVNWPELELGIITSSSLSVQAHADTHAGTHMLSFRAQRSSSSWFLARPPFPSVAICVSQIGKGATNTCGALVPPSWTVRERCASSLCAPESPVQLELCWPGQQAQPAAGFPRIWHYLKWSWTHLANEHSLALFLWALFSIGFFLLIRSFCPVVQSGKP